MMKILKFSPAIDDYPIKYSAFTTDNSKIVPGTNENQSRSVQN